MDKERKLEFIRVNHFLMTIQEMAVELKTRDTVVSRFCNQLGVVAITEVDREKEMAERKKRAKVVKPVTPDEELELLKVAAFIYKGLKPEVKKRLQVKYSTV